MNKNNLSLSLFLYIFAYLLRYISSFFLVFLIGEIFTMTFMLISHSGFEKLFTLLLVYTPFQKHSGQGSVVLGIQDIVSIFSFWSFVLFIIGLIFSKIYKPTHNMNMTLIFSIFLTALHFFALIRQPNVFELLPVVIIFYVACFVAWFFYKLLNKLADFLNALPNKSISHSR